MHHLQRYGEHHDGAPLLGLLLLILLAAAVAAVVVGLILARRGSATAAAPWSGPAPGRPPGPAAAHPIAAAEQTLAERLARGEIDVADYEQRLAALRRSMPIVSPPPANPPPGSTSA